MNPECRVFAKSDKRVMFSRGHLIWRIRMLQSKMLQSSPSQWAPTPFAYITQVDDKALPAKYHILSAIRMLDSLTLSNFKSFKGQHYLGPFLKLTMLVGCNGSGKSSVLDAIVFCLAGDKLKGAYFDPKDYISRDDDQTHSQLKKSNREAFVECKFQLLSGSYLGIKRSIDPWGYNKYWINGEEVQKQLYVSFLKSKNMILDETSNMIICQGACDSLLNKGPTKFRDYLQILSGSAYMKEQFDQLTQEIQSINKQVEEITLEKDRLKTEKKSMKFIKARNEDYTKLEKSYKQLLEKVLVAKLLERQIEINRLVVEVSEEEIKEEKELQLHNKKKAEMQQNFKTSVALKSEINQLNLEVTEVNFKLKELSNQNIAFKEQTLRDLKEENFKDNQTLSILTQRREELEDRLPKLQSTSVVEEYLKVYDTWQNENKLMKEAFEKKQSNLASLDRLIYSKQDVINNLKEKSKKFDVDKAQQLQRIKECHHKVSVIQDSIDQHQKKFSLYMSQYSEADAKLKSHTEKYEEKDRSIQELELQMSDENQKVKESSLMKKLQNVDGLVGQVEDKVTPIGDSFAVCFDQIMSSIDKYILVEDESTSKEVAARLRDLGKAKTLVILSNSKSSLQAVSNMRKELGDLAMPAMDIVNYDREITNLGEFLSTQLRSKVICKTLEEAFALKNKHIKGITDIYTMEGDVISMKGLISSHGDPSSILKNRKFKGKGASNTANLKKEIQRLEEEREEIKAAIKEIKSVYRQTEVLKKQEEVKALIAKKEEATSELERWKSYQPNNKKVQSLVVLEEELSDLMERREKLNSSIVRTEKEIESSPALHNFLQQHKIQSIECFRNSNNIEEIEKAMRLETDLKREMFDIDAQLSKIRGKQLLNRIEDLEEELSKSENTKKKKLLEKDLKNKQRGIDTLREQVLKLKVTSAQKFVSVVAELKQKLNMMVKSMGMYLQNLNLEYQTDIKEPDYVPVLKDMDTDIKRVDRQDIGEYIDKIKAERAKIEKMMEQFTSFNILHHSTQDDNIKNIEKKLEEAETALDLTLKERDTVAANLTQKKEERKRRFMGFVEALRSTLSTNYELLTTSGRPATHGTAQIFIENEETPFESAVYFCPTPPTKRFIYEIDQLSGGEKSIAYLAYQISIALITNAPVLVLDEVDAFLDNDNLFRFRRVLNKLKAETKLQLIIVSHKTSIFEDSESLIGVTNHVLDSSSKGFSLRL